MKKERRVQDNEPPYEVAHLKWPFIWFLIFLMGLVVFLHFYLK
jgi:hypothetical protein